MDRQAVITVEVRPTQALRRALGKHLQLGRPATDEEVQSAARFAILTEWETIVAQNKRRKKS